MKNVLTLLLASSILISCEDEPTKTYKTLDIELVKNELFVYNTKHSGDEEGGRIVLQAEHFLKSELARDDSTFQLLYKYQPIVDYVGTDAVRLELESGSDGSGPSNHFEYVTIHFNITI